MNAHIFGDVLVLTLWPVPLKQLFVSEVSAYRKQPRDDLIRLDTAEPPEGLQQYRTEPLSPCRFEWIYTSAHTYSHMLFFKLTNMFVFSAGCLLSLLTSHSLQMPIRLQIILRVC